MATLNFLFWNLQKKDLTNQVANLCISKEVDILILAENIISQSVILQKLNNNSINYYYNNPISQCKKILIITKFHYDFITPISENSRMTIRLVNLPLWSKFLLVGVHLVDKSNFSDSSQSEETNYISNEISKVETETGIDRTMVVGDFNMNPFETGMIKAPGFHATMSSNVANKIHRTVQDRQYKFFYNPMWSLYGDLNKIAAGTYYYRSAQSVNYDWNIFDQVLIRPSLISSFVKSKLEIVDNDGMSSFLDSQGRPNKNDFSDHLPIFFTLHY